jgi:hypothetical protein
MPSVPPARRWFSFSLRSLFVLVTLAAIGLAWVAYERTQSARQLQIIEKIKLGSAGVEIEVAGLFDAAEPGDLNMPAEQPSWWRRALSDLCGSRIRSLKVDGNQPLSDLSLFEGFSSLEDLSLRDTQVTDLSPLAALTNLTVLRLVNTPVDDLSPLAGLEHLQLLWLTNSQVSDLSPLAGLKHLQWVRVGNTPVNDLSPLASLKNVQHLALIDTQASDLSPLTGLTNLKTLFIEETNVSGEQVRLLQQALPNCQIQFQRIIQRFPPADGDAGMRRPRHRRRIDDMHVTRRAGQPHDANAAQAVYAALAGIQQEAPEP